MPAYHIEFSSESGAQRATFSIDDERPLEDQLRLVIEELRASGHVLQGGPRDQLVARWNGHDLDPARSPASQGMSPDRAIQLEMRAPSRAVRMVRPEGRIHPFLSRTAAFGPVIGAWAALTAWVCMDLWQARTGTPLTQLDAWVPPLLGAYLGFGLLAFFAFRREGPWLLEGLWGGMIGLIAGALYTELVRRGLWSWTGNWARIWAWAGLGGTLGLALGARWLRADTPRLLSGLAWGAGSGLLAGLLPLIAGSGGIWTACAFGLVGIGVSVGIIAQPAQRSFAVLELLGVGGLPATGRRWREWDLVSADVPLSGGAGLREAAWLRVDARGAFLASSSDSGIPIRVAHRPFDPDEELRSQDQIQVGDAWYRLRKRRARP